jgi:hypothetical protein
MSQNSSRRVAGSQVGHSETPLRLSHTSSKSLMAVISFSAQDARDDNRTDQPDRASPKPLFWAAALPAR